MPRITELPHLNAYLHTPTMDATFAVSDFQRQRPSLRQTPRSSPRSPHKYTPNLCPATTPKETPRYTPTPIYAHIINQPAPPPPHPDQSGAAYSPSLQTYQSFSPTITTSSGSSGKDSAGKTREKRLIREYIIPCSHPPTEPPSPPRPSRSPKMETYYGGPIFARASDMEISPTGRLRPVVRDSEMRERDATRRPVAEPSHSSRSRAARKAEEEYRQASLRKEGFLLDHGRWRPERVTVDYAYQW